MAQIKRCLRVTYKPPDKSKVETSHFNGIGWFWDKNVGDARVLIVTVDAIASVEDVLTAYRELGKHIRIALRPRLNSRGEFRRVKRKMKRGIRWGEWLAEHDRCMDLWMRWRNWLAELRARAARRVIHIVEEQSDGEA